MDARGRVGAGVRWTDERRMVNAPTKPPNPSNIVTQGCFLRTDLSPKGFIRPMIAMTSLLSAIKTTKRGTRYIV